MKIFCNDVRWLDENQKFLQALVREASLDSSLSIRFLELFLVTSDEMFSHNVSFLNHLTDTDVITIVNRKINRLDVLLIINKEFENNNLDYFLKDLILHGLLHALGWKDDLPILKYRMFTKQKEILDKVFHVEQK